eukprot:4881977-Pyramimonas_sp.AAC.1
MSGARGKTHIQIPMMLSSYSKCLLPHGSPCAQWVSPTRTLTRARSPAHSSRFGAFVVLDASRN